MESAKENSVQHFLDLIRKSKRGKFKIYIGMSAGVGKSYRMLQEGHSLKKKRNRLENRFHRNARSEGNTGAY